MEYMLKMIKGMQDSSRAILGDKRDLQGHSNSLGTF